ncbi:protein GOLVEN 7-like [Trifolium pratense]|uniref:protein GOLVEN 7-like n=1 Tax=Trifolium pratense TaxID=57577 RepID=UPI001E693C05|nr:protein GOLVEN 7-like [Trifolium pratense]
MVLIKSSTTTTATIMLVFLCAALLSSARLHPAGGAEVNDISSTKANVASETINNNKDKNIAAMDMKKQSVNSPKSSFHGKRSLSDEFVAFTADYHPPRHHPPKNNK